MSIPPPPPALLRLTRKAVSLLGNGSGNKYILWQLPQCNITSNPYGGYTGTYGLLNCIAIQNGAISAVVWFYLPPGGQGVLLSFQEYQYPVSNVNNWNPWLYVGTNGYLYASDFTYVGDRFINISTPISPGWHMAVIEEWATSTSSTGPYYVALYLDGNYIGQNSGGVPQLFGSGSNYPYNDIGVGFSCCVPATNGTWFFFNGAIAYVALYNRVLRPDEVMAIYQGCEITYGLVAKYTGDSYDPSTGTWVDTVNGYNATLVTTGDTPDVVNLLSLRDCPTCLPSTVSSEAFPSLSNCPTCPQPAVPSQAFPPIVSPTQPFVPPPRPP